MPRLRIFQIDAFTDRAFRGNPAAVCPLDDWLDDGTLQAIAMENNLSETAYFVRDGDDFHLRWFTPRHEVPLCGHATVASAFVILTELEPKRSAVRFHTKSGPLVVSREGDLLTFVGPALPFQPCDDPPEALVRALPKQPAELYAVHDDPNYYAVYESEDDVRSIEPDLAGIEPLHPYAVVTTAPGRKGDCVSRYYAPSYGIPEDPVTGSIHCSLVPYWAKRLGKSRIHAVQASRRSGELICEDRGDRVAISGRAVKYLEGTIQF